MSVTFLLSHRAQIKLYKRALSKHMQMQGSLMKLKGLNKN